MDKDDVVDVGSYITEEAGNRGVTPEQLGDHMLSNITQITIVHKGSQERVKWMPGHLVARDGKYGPPKDKEVDVLVIGKMPNKDDTESEELFSDSAGDVLAEACEALDIDFDPWYLTNVCRFTPPGQQRTVTAGWIKECK